MYLGSLAFSDRCGLPDGISGRTKKVLSMCVRAKEMQREGERELTCMRSFGFRVYGFGSDFLVGEADACNCAFENSRTSETSWI